MSRQTSRPTNTKKTKSILIERNIAENIPKLPLVVEFGLIISVVEDPGPVDEDVAGDISVLVVDVCVTKSDFVEIIIMDW